MTPPSDRERLMLRWYPRSWRDRYGDELRALVAEEASSGRVSLRTYVELAIAGTRERLRAGGLVGEGRSHREDVRSGALAILCAWSLFSIGGIGFQNLSENFQPAVAGTSAATISIASFDVIVAAAVVGVILLGIGALAALPAFVRFVRAGRLGEVRRWFVWAVASTLVEGGALAAILPWAHSLSAEDRAGALPSYSMAVLGFAVLTSVMLAMWTVAAVATARRVELSPRTLSLEGVLALTLCGLMAIITFATLIWWTAIASGAPWFFDLNSSGRSVSVLRGAAHPLAFTPNLLASVGLMAGATAFAVAGARRISRHRGLLALS